MLPALRVLDEEGRARPSAASLEALHLTLRALVDASRAAAGAVCLFDAEEAVLRLAAEIGLSDEGCRVLRALRCDDGGWDPPLTSLLDRKPCIIEDEPGRPIPPLVDASGQISTVACVPLYADDRPLGSAVLIAVPPVSLSHEAMHEIVPHVGDVECAISALHHQVDGVACRAAHRTRAIESIAEAAVQGINLAIWETQRLLEWAQQFPRLRSLAEQLNAPLARNSRRLEQLERKTQALWEELERVEIAERERQAVETALRARLYDAEARVSRQRQRVSSLKREHERTAAALGDVLERERRTREEFERVIERSRTVDRGATLARARELATIADGARAVAVAELETTRAQLAAVQAESLAAQDEARRASHELQQLRTARDSLVEEQRRLAASLEEVRAHERHHAERVAEVEEEARALDDERLRIEAAEEESEATDARWRTRLYDTEARVCRHRQALHILGRDHERTKAELSEALERERLTREELEGVIKRSAAERDDTLRQMRQLVETTESARAAAVAETEMVRAELADSRCINVETRDEVQGARAKIEGLEAAERTARAEQERLALALDEARGGAAEATAQIEQLEEELSVSRATVAPKGAPGVRVLASSSSAQQTAAAPSMRQTLVVLDEDRSWRGAEGTDVDVEVMKPSLDLAQRLSQLDFSHMVVNLAAPGVFDTLLDLRAGGYPTGFWGCLAEPGADEVVMLGMIEPISRPLDVDAVLVWLACFAPHGTRILAAGANVNALISLREALTRAGMSVSIAWDTKQTIDLVGMVRPQVVILDLTLPPHGAHAAIVQMGAVDPPPTMALIQGTDDPAAGFAAALKRTPADVPRLTRELCLAKLGTH